MNRWYLPIGVLLFTKAFNLFDFPIKIAEADKEVSNERRNDNGRTRWNISKRRSFKGEKETKMLNLLKTWVELMFLQQNYFHFQS